MINLLNGEFYKLQKSKSLLACCLVIVSFVLFMYGMLLIVDKIQKGEIENGTGGMVYVSGEIQESSESVFDELTVPEVLRQMFCSFGSFIIAVFTSIFVIGEYTNGAVKNIVGKGYSRWQVFAAKYISTLVAAALQLMVMTVVTILCGSIIEQGKNFNAAFWKDLCCYVGIQYLLSAALVGLLITISEVCRNLAAGISIGIGVVGFSSLITSGLDLLAKLVLLQSDFRPSDYWIIDLISRCPTKDINRGFVMHVIIVVIVWTVIAVAVGTAHIRKADIK